MATKKTAKKKAVEAWTADEMKVFNDFGVGAGNESLRRLIRGQRRINKKFYETLEVVLKRLQAQGKGKGKDQELARVIELNDGVPGESPGCGN